ncbi:MAG: hypothetical protein M3046_03000 [Actinomycetota bacterium]|nr:hypothetical protein [Actinomycetota bacterium]
MVFSTVAADDDWRVLEGDGIVDAVVSALAAMPTDAGNVSSSQQWSQQGHRHEGGRYDVIGKTGSPMRKVVAKLRARGITAQPLHWYLPDATKAYGMEAAAQEANLADEVIDALNLPSEEARLKQRNTENERKS